MKSDNIMWLLKTLNCERSLYIQFGLLKRVYKSFSNDRDVVLWSFQRTYRIEEYFFNKKNDNKLFWIPYVLFRRSKNKKGLKLGIDIGENVFDRGLFFAHSGSIIVGNAKVGKNCILHGDNTISSGAVMGDNCELWVGARVMDKARLMDKTIVGGGAVVVSCFVESGITIAGIPARKIS